MPIVFVHGVNNRRQDPDYEPDRKRMEGFLRNVFAPQIGVGPSKVSMFFPYWGDLGVKFRWNHLSIPGMGEALSVGGAKGTTDLELWLAETQAELGDEQGVRLAEVASEKSFEEATDLLWDTLALSATTDEQVLWVAKLQKATAIYIAKGDGYPTWARNTQQSNQEFLDALLDAIEPHLDPKGPDEALGLTEHLATFKSWLSESASRLASLPNDTVSTALLALKRKSLHLKASRFIGDILVYINSRENAAAPGPIVQEILKAIDAAAKSKSPDDPHLIVIGHSLGGVILYDILTHFSPDLEIDLWITVGSQVPVFEEMTMYKGSAVGVPGNPPKDRLPKPKAAKSWINVYDTNDVFSFSAKRIFDNVDDHSFDTGYGTIKSHGGYFARPSFYKRLGIRAKDRLK